MVATKSSKASKSRKATSAGRPKKDGLRKPQIRILAALKKAGKALDRAAIAEKAPCDVAVLVEYLGSHDDSIRKANDIKHFKSLRSYGYVKAEEGVASSGMDGRASIVYSITAAGRAALEKALAEEKAREKASKK